MPYYILYGLVKKEDDFFFVFILKEILNIFWEYLFILTSHHHIFEVKDIKIQDSQFNKESVIFIKNKYFKKESIKCFVFYFELRRSKKI